MIKTRKINRGKGKVRRVRKAKDRAVHQKGAIRKLPRINQYVSVIIVDFASSLLMGKEARGASMCV